MSQQHLVINYTSFNAWANTKEVDWLQQVDESLLYKHVPNTDYNMYTCEVKNTAF